MEEGQSKNMMGRLGGDAGDAGDEKRGDLDNTRREKKRQITGLSRYRPADIKNKTEEKE